MRFAYPGYKSIAIREHRRPDGIVIPAKAGIQARSAWVSHMDECFVMPAFATSKSESATPNRRIAAIHGATFQSTDRPARPSMAVRSAGHAAVPRSGLPHPYGPPITGSTIPSM